MSRPSNNDRAASSITTSAARPRQPASSLSYRPSAPILAVPEARRRRLVSRLSSYGYHTFPTPAPKTPSEPADGGGGGGGGGITPSAVRFSDNTNGVDDETRVSNSTSGGGPGGKGHKRHRSGASQRSTGSAKVTPLPKKQLCLLALLSLAEQTALNSISPYLPLMVETFEEIPAAQAGLYVGLLASAFAMAQLTSNFAWGYFSDVFGRKPIMLIGTTLLMVCFVCFGFCAQFWQLLLVHIAMGLLNGNAAVVPTVLGEVTDRSNQSKAFTWLPVMYSVGGLTGPALGGLLVGKIGSKRGDLISRFPFLGPNIMSAALLLIAVIVLAIWFDETIPERDKKPFKFNMNWVRHVCSCECLPFGGSRRKDKDTYEDGEQEALLHNSHTNDEEAQGSTGAGLKELDPAPAQKLLNWTTLSILFTYLIFQVGNISFNSLFPIFADAPEPTGRDLGPGIIGVSLSLAGLVTIVFQISLFEPLKARVGNLGAFRLSLLGLGISMALMPWVGYLDTPPLFGLWSGRTWLYIELGVVLVIKNLCAVGGLSCVLLLITNSAPSHETLGTLNGLAQTLSAAGRSFGPLLSGGLFTFSTRIKPKGELLVWGVFAGFSIMGWLWTLVIKGDHLESEDFIADDDDDDVEEEQVDGDRTSGASQT